jgi:hypothetical protein
MENRIPLNDQARLENVLTFWPKASVDDLVGFYLENAKYPTSYGGSIEKYKSYIEDPMSEFSNPKIDKAWKKFNASFSLLRSFLIHHFWVPDQHYKTYGAEATFNYLEPNLHHNFNQQTKAASAQWDDYKTELDGLADSFAEAYSFFVRVAREELEARGEKVDRSAKTLKSIHLLTDKLVLSDHLFLVLDGRFESPVRCDARTSAGATYIGNLYKIAYIANVPGTRVSYDKDIADSINNKLFRRPQVAGYMGTHGLKKPTLVIRAGDLLVLKNEVQVKTGLIHQVVPQEFRSLYTDKTN